MLTRVTRAWRTLVPEERLAAFASLLLFVTMFLPWYQLNAVVNDRTGGRLLGNDLTAFGVFSFVEAAVLLVAIAVLALLFARAEGRAFHLPGGDGTIVTIAGGWVVLLLVWRLFDKPDVSGSGVGNVGIQWGIFFALGAAGLLTLAGTRMRAAHRPEPGSASGDAEDGPDFVDAEQRARRRRAASAAPGTELTRPLPAEPAPADADRSRPARRRARPAPAAAPAPPAPSDRGERPRRRTSSTPLPPPPATERLRDRPTERLPEPPTERLPDPPTERLPDPPTERLDPPTERYDERRARRGENPQAERLFDDR